MPFKDAVELACQIGYEYENPGWEHISDMMATYEDERPPCDGDTLYNLTMKAVALKKEDKSYKDAVKELCQLSQH